MTSDAPPQDPSGASDGRADGELARSSTPSPVVLALISAETEALLARLLVGLELPIQRVPDAAALRKELTQVPTLAAIIDDPDHFGAVALLKNDETLQDVPVLYVVTAAKPDNRQLQDALRAGCEDVAILEEDDGAALSTRLEAILRYHRRYGLSPPSGHWLTFDKDSDSVDDHYPESDEHLTMRGSQRFIEGADGAPHLLLISNHPSYRQEGQRALAQGGYHVSFFDSGFLALRFLHQLAAQKAPDIPSNLQGKLDLVIVALEGSPERALTLVRQLKAQPSFTAVPILLLVNDRKHLDVVAPYRDQGVYTTVGAEHQAEDLVFRIYEIFQAPNEPFYAAWRQRHTVRCGWRRVTEDGDAPWRSALTYNMNRYGVYVQTISPPLRDEPVELRFRVRQFGVLLEFAGPVIWSTPWIPHSQRTYPAGFGVSLQRGHPTDFESLADFCDFLSEM